MKGSKVGKEAPELALHWQPVEKTSHRQLRRGDKDEATDLCLWRCLLNNDRRLLLDGGRKLLNLFELLRRMSGASKRGVALMSYRV